MTNRLHLVGTGFTLSNPGMLFRADCPYTCCRICGAVFQSTLDRQKGSFEHNFNAMQMRKGWSITHAKLHSDEEHLKLAKSGMWATPEAAKRLAAYGIIALSDMVLFDESSDALRASSPIPINDVEGGTSVLRDHL